MSEPEASPRKGLSSRRASFSSVRSRIMGSKKKANTSSDDEQPAPPENSKRWSRTSDHTVPPVPTAPESVPAQPKLAVASVADPEQKKKLDEDISVNSRALGAFQDTIPLTMLFFGGTVVTTLILARFSLIASVLLAICSGNVLYMKLQTVSQDTKWTIEMEQAAKKAGVLGQDEESVEWLNKALATAWPLINSDYFAPFVDLLEDSLMTQVPGIVHSVRVEDMDQGSIPLKVKSFRLLPSDESCFLEGAVAQARKDAGIKPGAKDSDGENDNDPARLDDDAIGIDLGDFVNLEVTFAYRGAVPKKHRLRTSKNTAKPLHTSEPVGAEANEDQDEVTDGLMNTPTERIHLLLYLSVGLQKLAAVDIPVWIEMVGIEGKARVRLQMTPVAPFIKHAAVTFVGPPKIEMSAKPLGKKMVIDAMNLPLMTTYVRHAVEDVIRGFIAPLSYTIDVAGLLGSGDGPSDVYAVGVLCVVLHQADNLAAADSNGKSDPFVQASFARAGKPLFTSRIIRRRRDAIWHETTFLVVSPDEVRDHDRLRLTVFDADRFSADDPLGKVEISIDRLIRKFRPQGEARSTNLLETRNDELRPMRKGLPAQGTLKYSVGFFGLAHTEGTGHAPSKRKLLQRAEKVDTKHEDSIDLVSPIAQTGDKKDLPAFSPPTHSPSAPSDENGNISPNEGLERYMTGFDRFVTSLGLPMDDEILQKRKERKERVAKLANMIEGAKQSTMHPPQTEFPSGILAFHIHSLHNLEVPSTQKSLGTSKRLSHKPRHAPAPTDESQAEGIAAGRLPSSYVQVFLNDEAIFRTRTKTLNPRPYINAGTERFIGDWTTARIDFTVRDARMRESDAILGCVGLKISDLLQNSSRTTGLYTLVGGLGYGKIRLTILFRSIEMSVPRPLRGWNIGLIEVENCKAVGMQQGLFDKKSCQLLIETVGGKATTDEIEPVEDYESGVGDAATVSYEWPLKSTLRIPVRQRYPNLLHFTVRSDSRMPGRHHQHAMGFIALNRIADETPIKHRVRLFESSDWDEVEQNMMRATTDPELLQKEQQEERKDKQHQQLGPVLEELCSGAAREVSDATLKAANLKPVGWLELSAIYHRGIGPEHRSCTAGDNEMRFAYDTYNTLVDANERSPIRSLAAVKRYQEVQKASKEETGDSKLSHRRMPSTSSSGGQTAEESDGYGEDANTSGGDQDSLYAGSISEAEMERMLQDTDPDTPEGRRARARALHRNERGAAQIKSFRTLTWMKTNAEDSMAKVKRQFGKQSKKMGKMESEGISHF